MNSKVKWERKSLKQLALFGICGISFSIFVVSISILVVVALGLENSVENDTKNIVVDNEYAKVSVLEKTDTYTIYLDEKTDKKYLSIKEESGRTVIELEK